MILVTSAAGNTGRIVVETLVRNGQEVLATDINPKVTELEGVSDAAIGDLTDKAFLLRLEKQVDQIIYIPPLFSAEETLIGKTLIELAIENKVNQFIFISVIHPILTSLLQHTAKRDVEEYLIYKGMETSLQYTILQPMHYMHNFNPSSVKLTGEYVSFYTLNSKVAYVSTEDVAEVALLSIRDPKKHDKATYELVGTQPYSPNELVEIFNQETQLQAVAKYIPVEQFLNNINGQDLYFRKGFEHLAESYSKWGLDGNINVLRMLLGREPEDFESYIRKNLN